MPRGGPRPGSGAPKGNINAVKHGRRSRQMRRAVEKLMNDTDIRAVLLLFSAVSGPAQADHYQEVLETHARMVARKRAAERRRRKSRRARVPDSPPEPHDTSHPRPSTLEP